MDSDLETALLLHRIPLFADLHPEALLPLARLSSYLALAPNELLFAQGSFGDALFIIVHGALRIERNGEPLARLGQGEAVGELAVLDWQPRSADAIADVPTTLLRVERNDLMDLLQEKQELLHALIALLSRRIRARD